MRNLLFLLFILLFTNQLLPQNPSVDYLGSWFTYGSNHRVSERISITPYAELRFYEPSSNYNLAFISVTGNYHLSSKSALGFGYAYLDIDTVFEFDHIPSVKENRILEQFVFNYKLNKFKIQHRARLEQRFLLLDDSNELQQRFRYRISFKHDINKTFFLAISEEPFVNFQDQVFHENRLFKTTH